MTNRKLQAIMFGVLLTFSAVAQSQTAAINNPLLTQLARQFAAEVVRTPGGADEAALVVYNSFRAALTASAIPASGGSLVIDGTVQEGSTVRSLLSTLIELARQPGFSPESVTILTAASPNS